MSALVKTPRVTIGLSVHNGGRFLELVLRSIYAQTYQDWELIIADDGSTDGGVDFVRNMDDARIRVLGDGVRRGLSTRLNQIASAATGHYLARMDADDLMHPQRLQAQIAFMEARPDIDVVGCALLFLDRQLRPTAVQRNPETHEQICANPVRAIRVAHPSMLARTAWFRSHPYQQRNRRCEDWQLLYNSRSDSRYANLSEALYFYRAFDSFSLHKYCACKICNTRLWWGLPSHECSRGRVLRLTLRNFFDMGVYAAARAVGQHDWLIHRRCVPLTTSERESFPEVLRTIQSCPLPFTGSRTSA